MEADVFISHSHADEKLAKGLAGWLHSCFGLTCFIDSCVWGYADDLLEMINDEYSDKKNKPSGGCIYDHKKCNTASKHVNTMLTIALYKMIDKSEITILLNTNSSIKKYKDIYQQTTYSPWIYLDCQHFFRQIFLGYFSDIVQAFDTLRKNVCGDDYTSLHNPIVLSSVLPAYGMFHSIQILFL